MVTLLLFEIQPAGRRDAPAPLFDFAFDFPEQLPALKPAGGLKSLRVVAFDFGANRSFVGSACALMAIGYEMVVRSRGHRYNLANLSLLRSVPTSFAHAYLTPVDESKSISQDGSGSQV